MMQLILLYLLSGGGCKIIICFIGPIVTFVFALVKLIMCKYIEIIHISLIIPFPTKHSLGGYTVLSLACSLFSCFKLS